MPGPVSETSKGPPDDAPYVPTWCYPGGTPKVCPCGHHEGYHNDDGECLMRSRCGCSGIPSDCVTSDEEFFAGEAEGRER